MQEQWVEPDANGRCPSCGAPLHDDLTGVPCLRCLLLVAAETAGAPGLSAIVGEGGPAVPVSATPLALPDPYEDRGTIGMGGMGEVRRVYDRSLQRVAVMKVLRAELLDDHVFIARFVEEARATRQLEHPGIVPVHEQGYLADGRPYYVMKEVTGYQLREIIDDVHAGVASHGSAPPWSFRRLVIAFLRVCETISFAHNRGVLHRDLKPSNIMVGEHGEVMVIDWGLVKYLSTSAPQPGSHASDPNAAPGPLSGDALTQAGSISGTPAYMAPEQARGQANLVGPATDVYSLGAILHQIITGHPPRARRPDAPIPPSPWPPPLSDAAPSGLTALHLDSPFAAPGLVALCQKAMADHPKDRFASASAFAQALESWLEKSHRTEQAEEVLESLEGTPERLAKLWATVQQLRDRADTHLNGIQPHEPEERRHFAWDLQDEADELEKEADLLETSYFQRLRGALSHDPEHAEAHHKLAAFYHQKHHRAEARGSVSEAAQWALMLQSHDHRGAFARYLKGDGRLTLITEPAGAQVQVYRFAAKDRRMQPCFERSLGPTPLIEVPLEMGSYVLKIQAPGHHPVLYPVFIERESHWAGIRPGSSTPEPIWLPSEGSLEADDCYVPAGWFWAGGDDTVPNPLPRRRVWVDAFVIKRFPVTHRQFLRFLNDLVDTGREAEALRHAPRRHPEKQGQEPPHEFTRDNKGHFSYEGAADIPREANTPIFRVDRAAAWAYCQWHAQRTGRPWSLPGDYEWEKAARGVDGRLYPWGDFEDASWANVRDCGVVPPRPVSVLDFLEDSSPYGVRGMAGNLLDYCSEVYDSEGPPVRNQIYQPPPSEPPWGPLIQGKGGSSAQIVAHINRFLEQGSNDDVFRAARGGCWAYGFEIARATARHSLPQVTHFLNVGFRLALRLNIGQPVWGGDHGD